MAKLPASLFNDVIGPVMRGPSSSHVAGAARIGTLVRQSLGGDVRSVPVEFDVNGSLAESYHGHGSDIGFVSGLLDIDLTDPRVPDACAIAEREGVEVAFSILDYGASHPNNYRIAATGGDGRTLHWEAVSVGGGMVEMQRFEGFPVSIDGGYHEYLLLIDAHAAPLEQAAASVKAVASSDELRAESDGARLLINLKRASALDAEAVARLRALPGVAGCIALDPILPTRSWEGCSVPFSNAAGLLEYAKQDGRPLWELAARYESVRGNTTEEDIFNKMDRLVGIMEKAVEDGLAGTEYADRILGPQAHLIDAGQRNRTLLPNDLFNNVTKYITAIMEVKSAMGVIVAAPTAGSCGGLPGTLIGVGRTLGLPREEIVKAMLAAGLIGVFIAESATFAAEVAGCQVECGAGSGMAAAGVALMLGGTVAQCLDAASMALQNITGLACDPVANRVEVPCLGKNIMCGFNAVACANMALAGFDKVIPLDETIAAVYDVGLMLPLDLRCTLGGLGKTPASFAIRKRLS